MATIVKLWQRQAHRSHKRELQGILSRHEKQVLLTLAHHVPARVTPDHLTAIGLGGAVLTGVALALARFGDAYFALACAGLLINWLGNSLDGTLARIRGIERPRYGFYVDHLSDVAAQLIIVLGLGLSPYMRLDIACLALVAYLVTTVYTLVRLQVFGVMCLSYFGVGPTEIRALLIIGIVGAWFCGPLVIDIGGVSASVYDLVTAGAAATALTMVLVLAVREGRDLSQADPRPECSELASRPRWVGGGPLLHGQEGISLAVEPACSAER